MGRARNRILSSSKLSPVAYLPTCTRLDADPERLAQFMRGALPSETCYADAPPDIEGFSHGPRRRAIASVNCLDLTLRLSKT